LYDVNRTLLRSFYDDHRTAILRRPVSHSISTQPRTHLRATLLLACLAQFMVILDVSVVNVALPSIHGALHFSEQDLQWVVNAYTVTFAGFLLLGGRAADLLGRRKVFVAGLVLTTNLRLIEWVDAALDYVFRQTGWELQDFSLPLGLTVATILNIYGFGIEKWLNNRGAASRWIVTMLLIAVPMYVLYESSIWIIVLLERSWRRETRGV